MTKRTKAREAVAAVLAALVAFAVAHRASVLEVVGSLLIVGGVAMWSVPVALILAGVALLLIAHPIPLRWKS